MEKKQGRRTVKRVRLSVRDVAACQDIVIPEHWSSAAEAVASHQGNPPIVVVCGPKNSGKSTFARFLVNTLLTRHKMVGYLDTDVGQPEYTPPGCLSLHIIDRPNHDISSKSDPRAYIGCVTDLYDHFYEKHHRGSSGICGEACSPLVVNTPGWVKGVGYHILVDTLTHMAPTHVIQLRISEPDKNLPTGAFWLRGDQEAMVDLINVDAAKQDVLIQKHARLLRELRTVAYFRQCLPSDQNIDKYKELAYALAAHPPYEISISKVKVVHLHGQRTRRLLLAGESSPLERRQPPPHRRQLPLLPPPSPFAARSCPSPLYPSTLSCCRPCSSLPVPAVVSAPARSCPSALCR
ncbi:Polynucleotide 5'-hydroxyl-kinase [Nymphaea thermarum]|nr:Polynucleotide 5'-hydroxyl-kinase [Nymphaea thermarum]